MTHIVRAVAETTSLLKCFKSTELAERLGADKTCLYRVFIKTNKLVNNSLYDYLAGNHQSAIDNLENAIHSAD